MAGIYLTKKQKKLMRERRKKKNAASGVVDDDGDELARNEEEEASSSTVVSKRTIEDNNNNNSKNQEGGGSSGVSNNKKTKVFHKLQNDDDRNENVSTSNDVVTSSSSGVQKKRKRPHSSSQTSSTTSSSNNNVPANSMAAYAPRNLDPKLLELLKETTTNELFQPQFDESLPSSLKKDKNGNDIVMVPAGLSTKDAKKFRKDERRKVRSLGGDDTKITFIVEGDNTSHQKNDESENNNRKKRRKKEYPRFKDMIEEEKRKQMDEEKKTIQAEQESQLTTDVKARYVAMDCEMVGIGNQGRQSVLARVSMVDWYGEVLVDTFVKVPDRVTDFRTWVSGVAPKNLKSDNAMEPAECREYVAKLLKNKILVGHALKNDLDALMLQHPKHDIRDSARYRPFQKQRGPNRKWRPRKLRDLVQEHAGMIIQEEGKSHDSIDDARASMELFKTVRHGWEKELERSSRKK